MPAPRCQPLLFDFLPSRELIVERSAGQITSDAGLLPIRQFDQQWGRHKALLTARYRSRIEYYKSNTLSTHSLHDYLAYNAAE